jgi:hypothetical protein
MIIFICSSIMVYLVSVFLTRLISLKKNIRHRLDYIDLILIFFPILNSILVIAYAVARLFLYLTIKIKKFWKWFVGVR